MLQPRCMSWWKLRQSAWHLFWRLWWHSVCQMCRQISPHWCFWMRWMSGSCPKHRLVPHFGSNHDYCHRSLGIHHDAKETEPKYFSLLKDLSESLLDRSSDRFHQIRLAKYHLASTRCSNLNRWTSKVCPFVRLPDDRLDLRTRLWSTVQLCEVGDIHSNTDLSSGHQPNLLVLQGPL